MRGDWWTVFLKEMRETLRDRRTLLVMVVVPVLLYPVLLVVSEQLALFGMRQLEAEPVRVVLAGQPPPELGDFLGGRDDLTLVEAPDPREAVREGAAEAAGVVEMTPDDPEGGWRAVILYDAAAERSQRGRQVLRGALEEWSDSLLEDRLLARGLPPGFAHPVAVSDSSLARPEEVGGYALGRFLPLVLILITLLGAFYPAIDLAAGEKERGTLETLLTAPVSPGQVVTGKFLTVALVGLVAAVLNLASLLLTFQTGLFQLGAVADVDFAIPLRTVGVIFATLIPLAVLFAALFLGIAVRVHSFKEAQNLLTPVQIGAMLPAMLPIFPGIGFTPVLAVVPVAGVALFFREVMAGNPVGWAGFLALASTVVYAALALRFAASSFGREDVLFGEGEDGESGKEGLKERAGRLLGRVGRGEGRPTLGQAGAFVVGIALLFFYFGFRLQVGMGEVGILASQWLLLLLPALLFVAVGGFDLRETLSLRRPSAPALAGAVLAIAGGIPLAWFLAWAQSFVLPVPWELLEEMAELIRAEEPRRLLWLLLVVALTPAICEEVVFRGILLSGSRGRLSPGRLVLLNGGVFGAFHLTFETAFRFLPTAFLGVLLAWVVWRTRSIWTGVLMHFLNNGTIVLLAAYPPLEHLFGEADRAPPLLLLPLALLSLAAGAWVLERGGGESGRLESRGGRSG